jgi:predicted nucleic acid-binding protein
VELVVDANVLLSALLKEALTRELLLDSRLKLFAPEHLIAETLHLLKANSALRKRIRLDAKELEELFYLLTQEIETVTKREFISHMAEAFRIAPHREDSPYLALALAFHIPIWSNDKGMYSQDKIKVYTTKDLAAVLMKR